MYHVGAWLDLLRRPSREAAARRPKLSPNVLFLGLTSLFTDISSEMVVAVLPMYLVGFLRLSPVQFGLIDGLYQGLSGIVQLVGGVLTDRWRRYKEVAGFGYAASACSRIGLMASTQMAGITTYLAVDRLGKGLRTAPRDALISLSVEPERLGVAFGVHRAMDAAGAMLGPVLAFVILSVIRDGYSAVFMVSFLVAVIGVAVLGFFVENRAAETPAAGWRESDLLRPWTFLSDSAFRRLALATVLLSLMTVSDAFIYLIAQQRTGIPIAGFPLLYVGTSAVYLLFAVPVGRIADRVGRVRVFIFGYAVLLGLYGALLSPYQGAWLPFAIVALLGLYYAATEGVLMALGSGLVAGNVRASGLAVLSTVTATARFGSSVAVGIAWTYLGLRTTLFTFGVGLAIAVAVSWRMLAGSSRTVSQ